MERLRQISCIVALATLMCVAASGVARAEPILYGAYSDIPDATRTVGYDAGTPEVTLGAAGTGTAMGYSPVWGPNATIFTVANPGYHHLHIIEYVEVDGLDLFDWSEILMVPDGAGGWTPSVNGDDLWYSAYYTVFVPDVAITPWPVVTPTPDDISLTNTPGDILEISWDEGLAPGTQVMVDRWVTVPAELTQFAIFHYSSHVYPVDDIKVPEPATLGLVGLGLAGIIARRRRASRAA